MDNPYESERSLHEYLLFHFGSAEQFGHPISRPHSALHFAQRCVTECVDMAQTYGRALDLGCAVGGSSFALTTCCEEVIGIDFSHRFIQAAQHLQRHGSHKLQIVEEGDLTHLSQVYRPADARSERVRFQPGDAQQLSPDLGNFDVVLLANLIDRLPSPRHCLDSLPRLLRPGGQLIITSPYTWLESFTPQDQWLGGYSADGKPVRTLETLQTILAPHFIFQDTRDLPFLIREHARKFQWSVAEASLWIKR